MRRAIYFLFFFLFSIFFFSLTRSSGTKAEPDLQHWPQLPDSPRIDLLGYYCRCPDQYRGILLWTEYFFGIISASITSHY